MSKASPMSEEFHDWLDQCPVQWFRGEVTKDNVTYIFETPDEDEEEQLQASSFKLQAASFKLDSTVGYDRMNLERNNYGHNTIEKNSRRSGGDPETSKAGYGKV